MTAKAATAPDHRSASLGNGNNWLMLLLVVGLPLLIVLLWKFLPMNEYVREAIEWISASGWIGIVAFIVVYVLAALVGIPRTPLHIAAGVVFSFPVAMLVVLTGATTAFASTFTIARTVARDWVCKQIAQAPKVKHLLDLVDEEGFKLVLLMRMNLFIPGVLKGYGFGTTNIGFWRYLSASVLGFLPIALAHVYLGWAGGEAVLDEGGEMTSVERWLLVGGLVVSVLLVAGVYYYGKRALNRRYPSEGDK